MAMKIMNNSAAMNTLGELNKNTTEVGKLLARVSSGQKINSAGDSAAEYSISERMRVRIRGLEQDIQNVRTGKSLLQVAAGGIDDIVQELSNLKELALNAANDHNTDRDRAIIQKSFEQRMANIDDIASTTNYNRRLLLDGTYARYIKEVRSITETGSADSGTTGGAEPVVSTGVMEPNEPTITITAGTYTISTAGVYVLASGFTGRINIADGLEGVKITQADPSTPLQNVYIDGPGSGNANLWIEDLNIQNSNNRSWISFNGSDNVLSIKGSNTLETPPHSATLAMIHIGGGLTIEGSGSLKMSQCKNPDGAFIGTSRREQSTANLTINSGTYIFQAGGDVNNLTGGGGNAALIGSGAEGSIGNITINGGTFDIMLTGSGSCIGSGGKMNIDGNAASAGDITIKNATIRAQCDDGACIGSGYISSVGNITIENSDIEVHSRVMYTTGTYSDDYHINSGAGAGIGSGNDGANAGDIIIRDSVVNATSNGGAGIGSGRSSHAGGILLENVEYTAYSKHGEAIGKGKFGTIGSVQIGSSSGQPSSAPPSTTRTEEVWVPGKPLVIHTGTKANQALYCYINDMHTKSLKLDATSVTIREKAVKAISDIEYALDYALSEATTVGSYIYRLDFTEANLVTASESTQDSESRIRDADMAKEMVAYTKANVISQASQSMLAQANQNMSGILGLLQ